MTAPKAYYVGLDVSTKKTQVCIMDQSMEIVAEAKIDTDPEDIALWLWDHQPEFVRVGLEAGPTSQWLYAGLAKCGLPVVCVETRHAHDFMKSLQLNKNDKNDARGIHKAAIAVARRLSAILHRMWVDGTNFRWVEPEAAA